MRDEDERVLSCGCSGIGLLVLTILRLRRVHSTVPYRTVALIEPFCSSYLARMILVRIGNS